MPVLPDPLPVQPVSRPVVGVVHVPGSKSITNRALLLAALADGRSTLRGALFSDDTRYMAEALEALGIPVYRDVASGAFRIEGQGGKLPSAEADLFIGNSGTTARFVAAALALGNGVFRLDGVPRMRERPIQDLLDALHQLGVSAVSMNGTGCPPIKVRSSGLQGGTVRMRADVSSQYLTALLQVAPLSERGVVIEIDGELASKPYIDITLRMMDQWGASVVNHQYRRFEIPGGQRYSALEYQVEPDASSASYFFAAAAVTGGTVRVSGLGMNSLQGDVGFVDVLAQMGCQVRKELDYIEVTGPDRLQGVDVDMNAVSDTVMTLAAIAPFAEGPTVIRNVGHIRHKETDRLRALSTEVTRLGVRVEETPDSLTIFPPRELLPAEVRTYDDHRMAMSFAITGLRSPGILIQDPGCVTKTFPDFFERLNALCEPFRKPPVPL
jgi:3-phosphoshikimate 1-carboxyvinyltransferase